MALLITGRHSHPTTNYYYLAMMELQCFESEMLLDLCDEIGSHDFKDLHSPSLGWHYEYCARCGRMRRKQCPDG